MRSWTAQAHLLLQRLGTKGALGDFARSLCTLLAPSLVAPSHVVGLTRIARSQDEAAAAAAQDLLLLLAPAAPGLVAASADQVGRYHGVRHDGGLPTHHGGGLVVLISKAKQGRCHARHVPSPLP